FDILTGQACSGASDAQNISNARPSPFQAHPSYRGIPEMHLTRWQRTKYACSDFHQKTLRYIEQSAWLSRLFNANANAVLCLDSPVPDLPPLHDSDTAK